MSTSAVYNPGVQAISTLLLYINVLCLSVLIVRSIYQIFIRKKKIAANEFISNKPSSFTLWYCAICDLCIIASFFWWWGKITKFENICIDIYDEHDCNYENFCHWVGKSWDGLPCKYRMLQKKYYPLLWSWFGCYFMITLKCGASAISPKRQWYSTMDCLIPCLFTAHWCVDHCICCCSCAHFTCTKDGIYYRRLFWTDCAILAGNKPTKSMIFCGLLVIIDYFCTYGLLLIFGVLYSMDPDESYENIGDYAIFEYEVILVIVLLISKICLQVIYVNGNAYNERTEIRAQNLWIQNRERLRILDILRLNFGDDVGYIIFEYLNGYQLDGQIRESTVSCCGQNRYKELHNHYHTFETQMI